MKASEIKCRKCGRNALEIQGYLQRVSPKGGPMIVECRPDCDSRLTPEQAVIEAITGEQA